MATWALAGALASLALYALTAALTPISANDTWIHLVTGRLVLEEGAVPRVDRYSFTVAGEQYVAHEWLAGVVYALGERSGGIPGVILIGQVVPAALLLLLLWAAVRAARGSPVVALPLFVVVLTIIRHRVLSRPELFALVLFVAALAILLRDRRIASETGRRTRSLLWLPAIGVIWANVHGSFVLGPVLILTFAAAELADRLLGADDRRAAWTRSAGVAAGLAGALVVARLEPASFSHPAALLLGAVSIVFALDGLAPIFRTQPTVSPGATLRLAAIAALTAAAALANPRGAELYAFPLEFGAVNELTRTIEEWKPLFEAGSLRSSLALPTYVLLCATWLAALSIAAARGVLDRSAVAMVLVLGLLPLRHGRWMALFSLATLPSLVALLSARREASHASSRTGRLLALSLVAGAVAMAGVAILLVATATPRDPILWLVVTACAVCGACSIALSVTDRIRRGVAPAITVLACSMLAAVAFSRGIPEIAGVPRRPGFGIRDGEPVGAVEFLRRNGIGGRIFTEYDWAAYVIHELWPAVTVFVDSRGDTYGSDLVALFHRAKSDRDAARHALASFGADLMFVFFAPWPASPLINAGVLGAAESDPRWALVYLDDLGLLYARTDVDRPMPPPFLHLKPRQLRPDAPGSATPGIESDARRAAELAPNAALPRLALGLALLAQRRLPEAQSELERAHQLNPRFPAPAYLLGEIALEAGDRQRARGWFQLALERHPTWDLARRRMEASDRSESPAP